MLSKIKIHVPTRRWEAEKKFDLRSGRNLPVTRLYKAPWHAAVSSRLQLLDSFHCRHCNRKPRTAQLIGWLRRGTGCNEAIRKAESARHGHGQEAVENERLERRMGVRVEVLVQATGLQMTSRSCSRCVSINFLCRIYIQASQSYIPCLLPIGGLCLFIYVLKCPTTFWLYTPVSSV